MQQVHRFVCSVAGGQEGYPGTIRRNRQGGRGLPAMACRGEAPLPLPPSGHRAWVSSAIFPHLFLVEVFLLSAIPFASPLRGSARLSCGVGGTLAYPVVCEALLGRFRGD